jgi:hypothetical protein
MMPIMIFQEDGVWFADCPPIEITGYGMTKKEATASFYIMLREFFRYAKENGNLRAELIRLGISRARSADLRC